MNKARLIFMTTGCIISFMLAVFISVEAFGDIIRVEHTDKIYLDTFEEDKPVVRQPSPQTYSDDEYLQPLVRNPTRGTGISSEVTTPHRNKRPARKTHSPSFSLFRKNFNGAGRVHKGYQWNGCSKTAEVRGGFGSNKRCANNSRTILNKDFATHLNQKFMPCIRSAAKAAGINQPKKVFLSLGSVRQNRTRNVPGGRSNKWSQHAYGRALDIFSFNLYDSRGRRTYIKAHKRNYGGQNRLFYNKFVVCWKTSVRRKCGRGNGAIIHTSAGAALSRQGHRFYSNSKHANHIHLEFPNRCKPKYKRRRRRR